MEIVPSNQIELEEKRQRNHSIILSTFPVELWSIIIQFSSFSDLKIWRLACSTLNQLIFDRLLKRYHRSLFSYSALHGDLDLMVKIYERFKNGIKEMIEFYRFKCFRDAAASGHLIILQRICTWYGGDENHSTRYYMIESGVTDISFSNPWKRYRRPSRYNAFNQSAERGHLHILQQLITWYGGEDRQKEIRQMIESGDFYSFRMAAACGHLDVVEHLVTWYACGRDDRNEIFKKMSQACGFFCFREAARHGHLDMVKLILVCYAGEDGQEMIKNMIQFEDFCGFRQAAINGHLDVVKQILICYDGDDRPEIIKNMIQSGDFCCFKEAARNGHLDVLKQIIVLYGERDDPVDKCPSLDIAVDKAVRAQDVELLRLLFDWCSDEEKPGIFRASKFEAAASNGHLEVLQQFHAWNEQGLLELPRKVIFEAYRVSVLNGRSDIEEQLFEWADEKAKRQLKKLKHTLFG